MFYYSVFVWMHVCVWEGMCIYVCAYYDKSVKLTAQLEGTMWVSETKFRSPVLWKILLATETSFLPLFLTILKWPFLIFYDILIIYSVLRFLSIHIMLLLQLLELFLEQLINFVPWMDQIVYVYVCVHKNICICAYMYIMIHYM